MLTPPRSRPGTKEFSNHAHAKARCYRRIVGGPVRTNDRPPRFGNARMSATGCIEISEGLRRHHNSAGFTYSVQQRLNINLGTANDPSKRPQAGMDDDGLTGLDSARTKRLGQRV